MNNLRSRPVFIPRVFVFLCIAFLGLVSQAAFAQTTEVCYNPNLVTDTSKKSIKSTAFALIGKDSLKINYHSPGVRKRIIWGGLVPFDEVWVTGAHDATTIQIPVPIMINGQEVAAGTYALFTIPGRKEWTVIINKHWKQHLASEYDQKDDVIRVAVKPKTIPHIERLQYFIETSSGKGSISIAWEKVRIDLPFKLKN